MTHVIAGDTPSLPLCLTSLDIRLRNVFVSDGNKFYSSRPEHKFISGSESVMTKICSFIGT